MKLPWPIGAIEIWLGMVTLALGLLALTIALGGTSGGYTGAVQAFMRLQLIVAGLQVVGLFGLLAVISTQHRTLRRSTRSAAVVASRRATEADRGQIVTAAANLAAAAGALTALIEHQRHMSAVLGTSVEMSGIEIIKPVPPPE